MKKILLMGFLCLACLTAQAQTEPKKEAQPEAKNEPKPKKKAGYRVCMHMGRYFANVAQLNQYLREAGLTTLSGSGIKGLISLGLGEDDSPFHNNIEFGYAAQLGGPDAQARSTSLQSMVFSVNLGYKVINKKRHVLMPLLGFTNSEFSRLSVVNNTPSPTTLNAQLTTPNSTVTQINYRVRSFIHAGLEYRFVNNLMDIGVRAGHYFRLSRGKWFTGSSPISDAPSLNPLGTYVTIFVGF